MTVPSVTLSLTSESDEVVIPDGITAIRYTLTEDGQKITREIAVEPTDIIKYYKEEDGYYTLAVYDNTGAIKSKGYTMHSDNAPNISINYSEDINNNFTASDEYVNFIPTQTFRFERTGNSYNTSHFKLPSGVTRIRFNLFIERADGSIYTYQDSMEYVPDEANISVQYYECTFNLVCTKCYINDSVVYAINGNAGILEITYGTSISRS